MSSKQNDRHIIWSDIHLDFEDWRADLEEQYPDLSEDELIQKMYEINSEYLGDERMNLNVQLSQPILVVADIGRWDGRYDGYAEIKTGNIKDCLYSEMDMCEWYVDKYGDLRADAVHHDGTIIISIGCIRTPQQTVRLKISKRRFTMARQHEPI